MDIFWVRFSDPHFFFQSTICRLWPTMDIFWFRFSDPKLFFHPTIYGLWPTMEFCPIFGPKIFRESTNLLIVAGAKYIFCESNLSTQTFYCFCDKWKTINAVHGKCPVCWRITLIGIRFSQPKHSVMFDLTCSKWCYFLPSPRVSVLFVMEFHVIQWNRIRMQKHGKLKDCFITNS